MQGAGVGQPVAACGPWYSSGACGVTAGDCQQEKGGSEGICQQQDGIVAFQGGRTPVRDYRPQGRRDGGLSFRERKSPQDGVLGGGSKRTGKELQPLWGSLESPQPPCPSRPQTPQRSSALVTQTHDLDLRPGCKSPVSTWEAGKTRRALRTPRHTYALLVRHWSRAGDGAGGLSDAVQTPDQAVSCPRA